MRILIAEDNEDLREILSLLIDSTGDLQCVASTDSLDDVALLVAERQVQVAVLDLELQGQSALTALPGLTARFPGTQFLVHSGHGSAQIQRRVKEAGAHGFVVKSGNPDVLIEAIRGLGPAST